MLGTDLLGHGASPRYPDPEDYADFEEHAWSPARGREPVDAVGFSLGGITLLRIASAHPDRLRRLAILGVGDSVLGAGPAAKDLPGEAPDVIAMVEGRVDVDDPIGPVFGRLAAASRNDPRVLSAVLRRPQRALTTSDLHQITCPTLLIIGDRDFTGPVDQLAAAIPNVEVLTLPGVDHFATPGSIHAMGATLDFLSA